MYVQNFPRFNCLLFAAIKSWFIHGLSLLRSKTRDITRARIPLLRFLNYYPFIENKHHKMVMESFILCFMDSFHNQK